MSDTQNWVTATGDSSQRRGGNIGKRKSTLETIFKIGAGQRKRERERLHRLVGGEGGQGDTSPHVSQRDHTSGITDKATMKILL